jgi:voltage-gated potassium channel
MLESRLEMRGRRPFVIGVAAMGALLVIGTTGYSVIEGFSPFDAFYMTVITLSTVGYAEVAPLSNAGRLFTSIFIMLGLGAVFYTVTAVFGYFAEQGFRGTFWRRRMEREIARKRDHFIVCGYGNVGKEVAAIISKSNAPLVVVDSDPQAFDEAKGAGFLCVLGNASADDTLFRAGIRNARGLVAATASNAENVFITLSVKRINPGVFVVARACTEDAVPKMESAGANKVVLPLRVGGKHMAMMAMRPLLVSFIDTYFGRPSNPLELEDIEISGDSPAAGKTVEQVEQELGLSILALRKRDHQLFPKPAAGLRISLGDELVVLGRREQLEKVETETE